MKGEKLKVSHLYLTFSISKRYNNLTKDLSQWTTKQEEIHSLIKSLQYKGMGYRKISHYLNETGIPTQKGNKWGSNNVYSVLKRHKERVDRLKFINKEYEPVWSKMEIRWEKNI